MSYLYSLTILLLVFPQISQAIIPPDLIISVGSNLLQILGLAALALASVYSVLQTLAVRGVVFAKKYALLIVQVANLVAGGVLYWYISDHNNSFSLLTSEVTSLTEQVAVLEQENLLLASAATTTYYTSPCTDGATSTSCLLGKKFFSESYVVVSEGMSLEIDTNRIEVAPGSGVFNQYTYVNGAIDGTPVTLYSSTLASTSEPVPYSFVERHLITPENDLSTRATFDITLTIDGAPVSIVITGAEGDFITRDSLSYTRTQSVAEAVVTIKGVTRNAEAFVERSYSADADAAIFFPERDSIKASTVQFIVWDETKNFYLYDATNVNNPVPQYPSHVWLLKKQANGLMEKSFVGQHQSDLSSSKLAWKVEMPEFKQAVLSLQASEVFKSQDGRIRVELEGTVRDSDGTRLLHGVGHIID